MRLIRPNYYYPSVYMNVPCRGHVPVSPSHSVPLHLSVHVSPVDMQPTTSVSSSRLMYVFLGGVRSGHPIAGGRHKYYHPMLSIRHTYAGGQCVRDLHPTLAVAQLIMYVGPDTLADRCIRKGVRIINKQILARFYRPDYFIL